MSTNLDEVLRTHLFKSSLRFNKKLTNSLTIIFDVLSSKATLQLTYTLK